MLLLLPLLALAACSDETFSNNDGPAPASGSRIRLQADIDQVNVTRADDSGFADGDKIGIYAVAFGHDGNPGTLLPEANLVTNLGFTYNAQTNSWNGDRDIYFPDDKTPLDFYAYYPYVNEIDNTEAYRFTVARNQSQEAVGGKLPAYEQSDLLWAKSAGVSPSTPLVTLTLHHILAAVQVSLVEGEGFDDGEWNQLSKSVLVAGTIPSGDVNLSTGEVSVASGLESVPVIMNPYKDNYRAVIIPQTVGEGENLLTINVGEDSYSFTKDVAMVYRPSKLHKFTIEVSKCLPKGDFEFSLLDESITAWESDPVSHDGKVKEYLIVHVPEAGMIGESIEAAGLKASEIRNLKLTGKIDGNDFWFIRENMKYLEALNLKEVTITHRAWFDYTDTEYTGVIPDEACKDMKYLSTVVLPDKFVGIGTDAFRNTNITGSLDLPEGVIFVGVAAFSNWQNYTTSNTNLSGTLSLPSTLKYIGYSAFENCDFTGELVLPEGLEFIGESAFADCKNFTGELHLPHSIKTIGHGAFANMKGIKGNLEIPRHLTEVGSYGYLPVTFVRFPEAPVSIAEEAFWKYPLRGDMIIPESVTRIGRLAFSETNLSHVTFPKNLEFIEEGVCCNMPNLQDTIVIPPLIETIGEVAFCNCYKLEAVILPEKLQRIKREAFGSCFSLNYIRCDALTPPKIEEGVFNGVAKDNFTVEVPEESVDAYRKAPGWREFKRIAAYRNFVARPSKFNVLNKGGKKEIILNADADWEVAECPDWCHLDRQSGSKKTTLTLTVDAMGHNSAPRTGRVTFRLKGNNDYLTHINVGQYDYEYDEDSYLQLQKATKGNGIDLFFVGDGYDAIDISSGIYLDDMRQEMEYLFAVEPYTSYRDYFNVYTAFALSEDSGTEDVNHWRNTKFHGAILNSDIRLRIDWEAAMDYCAQTVPPIANRPNPTVGTILVMNTDMYEGVTYVGDSFCSVVTKSTCEYPSDARGLIQHEAGGHGIGWLGDEYIYHIAFIQKCSCVCCEHVDKLLADQAGGFALNMSLNSGYREVPWTHLIYNPAYGDIVDIYEGGYFHSRGVYRSEKNSCMNNNVPYFSTWSRQLIVQRIMKLAGEQFSLDNFYANDKRGMGKDFTSTTRGNESVSYGNVRHGLPPVRITDYKFGKKGGKR